LSEIQAPIQLVKPAGQTMAQTPPTHEYPLGHTEPQAPQLEVSLFKATQVPLQLVKPAGQTTVQTPPTHEYPLGHTEPQAPQLEMSLFKATQVPPQLLKPGGQTMVQTPLTQEYPLGHTVPQAPQLFTSFFSWKQNPPQLVKPGGQVVALGIQSQAVSFQKQYWLSVISNINKPVLGLAILPRWVLVIRGGKKPLEVLLTSSIAEVAGAVPVALIPIWAKVPCAKSANAINSNSFFMFLNGKNKWLY
jgi:hypothetical protein